MGEVIRICVVGFLVGLLARYFYPGPVPMGLIGSIVLGLCGSIVGGVVPRLISSERDRGPLSPAGFGGSILGAMLLIFLGHTLF